MTPIEIYKMKPVQPYQNNKAVPMENPMPSLLYGVELELENTGVDEWYVSGLTGTRDDSLRNNGWEYTTLPATFSICMDTIQRFFKKWSINADNYSERTSIHVHVNCQEIPYPNIASLIVIYQVFERLLFRFVGGDRDKNVFCVPLTECVQSYRAPQTLAVGDVSEIDYLTQRWQKYAALNILPLRSLGTIEFRHMYGHCDVEVIANWLRIIGCMVKYATENDYATVVKQMCELNTNSEYKNTLDLVFGKYADLLRFPNYALDIEDGVLNLKYSILDTHSKKKKNTWWNPPDPEVPIAPAPTRSTDELLAMIRQMRNTEPVNPEPIGFDTRIGRLGTTTTGQFIAQTAQAQRAIENWAIIDDELMRDERNTR